MDHKQELIDLANAILESAATELDNLKSTAESLLAEINEQDNRPRSEIIEEIAAELGEDFSDNYSGRGMFGRKCVSITTPSPNAVIAEAIRQGIEGHKTDNMGIDIVVYWPNISIDDRE